MRDMLPNKVNNKECGIINLGFFFSSGTHLTSFYKIDNIVYYFDSFGDVNPPTELIKYLGVSSEICYNVDRIQTFNDSPICEYLCVHVLKELDNGLPFENNLNTLFYNKYRLTTHFLCSIFLVIRKGNLRVNFKL